MSADLRDITAAISRVTALRAREARTLPGPVDDELQLLQYMLDKERMAAESAADSRPGDPVHDALTVIAADFLASQADGTNRKTCYQVTDGVQVTASFAR